MRPKVKWQNVHTLLDCWLVIRNVSRNPVTKVHILAISMLVIINMLGNHVMKCPHFAKQPAGHHNSIQKLFDKMATFCLRESWTWWHRAGRRGWTLCHVWQNFWSTPNRGGQKIPGWIIRCKMSQRQIVTADSLIGGRIVWVKLLCGQFVGEWIVDPPGFFHLHATSKKH